MNRQQMIQQLVSVFQRRCDKEFLDYKKATEGMVIAKLRAEYEKYQEISRTDMLAALSLHKRYSLDKGLADYEKMIGGATTSIIQKEYDEVIEGKVAEPTIIERITKKRGRKKKSSNV